MQISEPLSYIESEKAQRLVSTCQHTALRSRDELPFCSTYKLRQIAVKLRGTVSVSWQEAWRAHFRPQTPHGDFRYS